jgi:hypothetical protein
MAREVQIRVARDPNRLTLIIAAKVAAVALPTVPGDIQECVLGYLELDAVVVCPDVAATADPSISEILKVAVLRDVDLDASLFRPLVAAFALPTMP